VATKAIYIELIGDLTTEALAAFTRFVSQCSSVYSDNSTMFICANNELKEIYELLNSPADQ
jgi:hypothetical protein